VSSIPLSLGAYKRSLSPEAILLNAMAEPAPTQQEKPVAIRARSGFDLFAEVGSSPLRALFAKQGLFGDRAVIVMGTSVHLLASNAAVSTLAGSVVGQEPVDIDGGQDADLESEAWIATGSALYRATETDVTVDPFPAIGGAGASSVCCHRGFVIATEAGTDVVFVRVPGDGTWQQLSFISAEYSPDKVVAVRRLGEQVWLLGEDTAEAWALSADASPPMAPYGGLVFDYGCLSRSAAVALPGAIIWVDNAHQVQITNGGAPVVISDHGLSEQIRSIDPGDLRGSWYQRDGHKYYQLTLGNVATWVYDLTTKQWARRSTLGLPYSRISAYASIADVVLAGNAVTSQIYRLNSDVRSDAGDSFPVEFTAFAEVLEGQVQCSNLELICQVGDAPWNGDGSDPQIGMRYSDDGGESWSGWRFRPLGKAGQSRVRVRWNALGTIKAPYGRIFHFRAADPVGRRFSDLRLNVS
jgi:hypothetical protein